MNIKSHTGLVLAICTATGFALGLSLVAGYRHVEDRIQQVGPNSVALRDASRLRSLLGQWLLSTDLVLQGDESYMLNASIRQAVEIRTLIGAIRAAPQVLEQDEDLRQIEFGVLRLRDLVEDSRTLRGEDRTQRLAELAAKADALATPITANVERLESRMRRRSTYLAQELEEEREQLQLMSWLAAGLYSIVVCLSWLWTTRTMVRPIESLGLAAERAQVHESFALDEHGPDEVRRLTRNISSFVHKLQTAKETTEEEVRRRTNQLVKANNAKSEFLATMSHELRTPLNGIINMNELILGTELDREQIEFARTARNAAEALLSLINDILDFSKIEAKKLQLDEVPLNLRDVVDGAVEIMSGVAEAKHVELGCVITRDVPGTIVGDSMRLRQVMINLLNNAVKFTEKGHVVVRVACVESRADDDVLRFAVEDTGIGIPAHRQRSLFNAFEQVDSSTTRNFGGTGLGLAICKELAQLMGGRIGVDSEVGAGSTFWFTVAAGRVDAPDGTLVPEPDRSRRVVLATTRDLVAERLREQLVYLGIHDDHVLRLTDDEDVTADAGSSTAETLVILDVYGQPETAPDLLQQLRARPGLADARICALRDPMRGGEGDPALPSEVDRLLLPTRLGQLRDWILSAAPTDADSQPQASPTAADAAVLGAHVLVAEDNPINQRVATKILENAGLSVTAVANGEKAVEQLQNAAFDLVLMDCQMPVMDGWTATRRIRELESDGALAAGCPSPLPIVALTANALAGDREKCLEAGMTDYLAKPFRPHEILETIGKYVALATTPT